MTVALAHFEDLVAIGLRHLVEEDPNLSLVAEGFMPSEVNRLIGREDPRVVVLNFGSLHAPSEVSELHRAHPHTRIVVLANRPTASECNQMLSFGATACLSKETQGRDVVNALHLASRGMHVLPRSAGARAALDGSRPKGSDLLTPREADVLELLQEGRTNAQVARALSIGIETVRTHARGIYRKLGISSRRDLGRPGAKLEAPASDAREPGAGAKPPERP